MTKNFTKGQRVHLIQSWNDKGTFYITRCIVQACGAKRMVLIDEKTGECVGREFRPQIEQYSHNIVVANETDEDAEAIALEVATMYQAHETDRVMHSIEFNKSDDGYCRAMQRYLDQYAALSPNVIWK